MNPQPNAHLAVGDGPARAWQTPITLNLNESPYGLPALARQAASDAIALSSRYQFARIEQLRQALAERHDVPVEWVSLYPGSNRALHYATLAFTTAERPLVVGAPGYLVPEQAARLHARPVCQVPLMPHGEHDVQRMLDVSAGGLIYIANPNNPTGTITPHAALCELLAGVSRASHPPVVLVDEAYLEFSDEPSMIAMVKAHSSLVVTRTFSKIHGLAGLRLGYAIAQPVLLQRIHTQPAHDVPVPAAAAALACLEDDAERSQRKHDNATQRAAFCTWLHSQGLGFSPSHSNCVLIDCKQPSAPLIAAMAQLGVYVGRPWPGLEHGLRVTLGTGEEMQTLRQALARVLNLQGS